MTVKSKLLEFMMVTMDHAVDGVRVPITTVQGALDDLRVHFDAIRTSEAFLLDKYNDIHEYPRKEWEQEYAMYLLAKNEKYQEWLRDKKLATLHEYINMRPDSVKYGNLSDIFTKYVV